MDDVELLKMRIDQASAVELMSQTEGWQIIKAHLEDQLNAYVQDNAINAADWDDYQKKAGKIFGIRLLFVDVDDFVRMGKDASDKIDQLKADGASQ